MAVGVAQRAAAGRLPGYLDRLVNQLKKPKVNWRDQTREFIDGVMASDYAWARPNRRFLAQDLILPGYVPDALHHLVGAIDVSGSVSESMMVGMVSEFAGALDEGIADKLTIIYFDTEVRHVDEFMRGDIVKAKVVGGGGTDFADTFRWIKENATDASCVVYLTDMETCSWGEEPECPVLWGVFNSEERMAQIVPPFGKSIHVDSLT
jgi:predicted metal-dependent peptidase